MSATLTLTGPAIAVIVLASVSAALLTGGLWSLLSKPNKRVDAALAHYRIGSSTDSADAHPSKSRNGIVTTEALTRVVDALGSLAARRGVLEGVQERLDHAHIPMRAAEGLFVYVAAVAIGTALGAAAGGVLLGALVFFAVAAVPWFVLDYVAKKRSSKFTAQLPDLLQLLATTLRSGFSIMQGLETVAMRLGDPMGEEMRTVVSEVRLGRNFVDSLHDIAKRVGSVDFEWVVTAIAVQREVGGNLAELLDVVAETMIARSRLRREVKTLTAEGRISAAIIALLPIGIGGFVYSVNRAYILPMFHSFTGKLVLGFTAALAVGGIVWMKKIVRIEI